MKRGPSINELSSTVQDNGRRGEPKAGCDCMQCFGYCSIDQEVALRSRLLKNDWRGGRIQMKQLALDARDGEGIDVALGQIE